MRVFTEAKLPNALFMRAKLDEAVLASATATEASFQRASLKRARCARANLMQAIFERADLTEADLRGREPLSRPRRGARRRPTWTSRAANVARTKLAGASETEPGDGWNFTP